MTGATVTDALPANFTNATWTATYTSGTGVPDGTGSLSNVLVNLLSGGTATFTVTGLIDASATGTLVNTATVTAPEGWTDTDPDPDPVTDTDPDNNSATDTDTLTPRNNVSVTKTDGISAIAAGRQTTYTIVVSNSGPSTATSVLVTDNLPSGITVANWYGNAASGSGSLENTITSLLPNQSVTYTFTMTVSATFAGRSVTNTATVSAANDTNPDNNSASDTDAVQKGLTLGYYSNKNGRYDLTGATNGSALKTDLTTYLNGLFGDNSLVDASGKYVSISYLSNYNNLNKFLLGASATNMANMLSAQLLTTAFNVFLGRVDGTQSVNMSKLTYGGAVLNSSQRSALVANGVEVNGKVNINQAMQAAVASLRANQKTVASGSARTYQEGLKNIFDAINNNQDMYA